MKRENKIKAGKLWQVYLAEDSDCILHEGSRTECFRIIRRDLNRSYLNGVVKLRKLIWESEKVKNEKSKSKNSAI